jgi:hypothetical protein
MNCFPPFSVADTSAAVLFWEIYHWRAFNIELII